MENMRFHKNIRTQGLYLQAPQSQALMALGTVTAVAILEV